MGKSFILELEDWAILFMRMGPIKRAEVSTHSKADAPVITHSASVRLRCLMSLLVNSISWTFLICSVPLVLLASSDGMDFVKDCLAIGYITTLDDVNEEDTIKHLVHVEDSCAEKLMGWFYADTLKRSGINFELLETTAIEAGAELERQRL